MKTERNRLTDFFLLSTTMGGDAASLRQRLRLILRQPKMLGTTLVAVLLVMALAAACAFGGAADPGEPAPAPLTPAEEAPADLAATPREYLPPDSIANAFTLAGEGVSLTIGSQQGEFPWGNQLDYEMLGAAPYGDQSQNMHHDVDCGELWLHFTRNQEDGNEYLWQARTTRPDLTTLQGVGVGSSVDDLLAAYPAGLYHATTATRPYSADHFCLYDELYGYGPEWAFCFHLVFYLYQGVVTGVELYDLMDGRDFTSPGEETIPEQESDISPSRWVFIGYHTLKEYADPATAPAEAMSQFYDNLPRVDWGELNLMDAPEPGNQGGAMAVLEYLFQQESFSDGQLLAVINASATNLDGAYAEGFFEIVSRQFLADSPRFLTLMAQADPPAQARVATHVGGHLYYYLDPPWENDLTGLDGEQQAMLELILAEMERMGES